MIVDQLKKDIRDTLQKYINKFPASDKITHNRKLNIQNIETILEQSDPVYICSEINNYLDGLAVPFLSWLTLFDIYAFIRPLKEILRQEKYQEINLLRAVVKEKDQVIASYHGRLTMKKNPVTVENQLEFIIRDLKLLKGENKYLYATLESLDRKIIMIEAENKLNFQRAITAEEELGLLRKQYGIGTFVQQDTLAPGMKIHASEHVKP